MDRFHDPFENSSMVFHAPIQRRRIDMRPSQASALPIDDVSLPPRHYAPPDPIHHFRYQTESPRFARSPMTPPFHHSLPALPSMFRGAHQSEGDDHYFDGYHQVAGRRDADRSPVRYAREEERERRSSRDYMYTEDDRAHASRIRTTHLTEEYSHHAWHQQQPRPRMISSRFRASSPPSSHQAPPPSLPPPPPPPSLPASRGKGASAPPRARSLDATDSSGKKKRKARICTADGCTKYVVDHGLCIRHGGGKRCYIEGCDCRAQNRGLCWKHGGFTICKIDGCTKRAKSRGICWSHGGGTRCKRDDCSKIAVSNGLCWAHGGGKRCEYEKCRKPASERTGNMCSEHNALLHGFEDEEAVL